MQRLEVSGVVRPIYGSLGVKRLNYVTTKHPISTRRKVFLIHCLLELVHLHNDSHAIRTETCLLHIRLVNMHIIVLPACVLAMLLLLLCMVVVYAFFPADVLLCFAAVLYVNILTLKE